MKRFISIIIFIVFSSMSFAEEIQPEWKWEKVYNSIVLISSENSYEKIVKEAVPEEFFDNDEKGSPDEYNEFEPQLPNFGMGTGFFINRIHIVTNYHVIKNFEILKVYAYNHPFAITDVKLIVSDQEVDIAVLEILEDVEHDSIPWADNAPLIGDSVYALGHGISQIWSLTQGILSYDYRPHPGTSFVHYYQTDAVINAGNSGGPLLNEKGEVVGVNTLLVSPDKYYVGYGYVIPAKLAKRTVSQILATGQHVKPSIGIMMGIIDDRALYKKLKADEINHFLEIKEVVLDSPANRFGLLAGDIIVSIDDTDIQVVPHVIEFLWEKNPGDEVSFTIYRNNEYTIIDVVLGKVEAVVPIPFVPLK